MDYRGREMQGATSSSESCAHMSIVCSPIAGGGYETMLILVVEVYEDD